MSTPASEIKVGIIGAGGIANDHIKGINAYPGARVVAIADANPARLKEVQKDFNIPQSYPDARALLKNSEIDAVVISLPNYLHMPVSIAALAAGKHVLLEKPMAMNITEARRIAAAARKYKRVLMLGMNFRFLPKVQMLKTMIRRGELGEIYHVKAYWLRRSGCPRLGTWFTQKKLSGGGAMLDIGVHVIDAALYLLDNWKPLSVSAATYSKFGPRGLGEGGWGKSIPQKKKNFDVDDYACAFVRLAKNVSLLVEISWARHAPTAGANEIELFGTEAGAAALAGKIYRFGKQPGEYEVVEPQNVPMRLNCSRQAHWLDVIAGKAEPETTVEQALVVQEILDAIYRSAQLGKEMRI